MTVITGKEADALFKRIADENAKIKAEALATRKAEAAGLGKEPFDLEKLETMCDTSYEGRVDPIEERRERYEYMYYVNHPSYMTLRELADLITRSAW